jgi:hypothetical protein
LWLQNNNRNEIQIQVEMPNFDWCLLNDPMAIVARSVTLTVTARSKPLLFER